MIFKILIFLSVLFIPIQNSNARGFLKPAHSVNITSNHYVEADFSEGQSKGMKFLRTAIVSIGMGLVVIGCGPALQEQDYINYTNTLSTAEKIDQFAGDHDELEEIKSNLANDMLELGDFEKRERRFILRLEKHFDEYLHKPTIIAHQLILKKQDVLEKIETLKTPAEVLTTESEIRSFLNQIAADQEIQAYRESLHEVARLKNHLLYSSIEVPDELKPNQVQLDQLWEQAYSPLKELQKIELDLKLKLQVYDNQRRADREKFQRGVDGTWILLDFLTGEIGEAYKRNSGR